MFNLPILLALIPFAVAGIVYAYRQKGRGRPLVVASVFILKTITKASSVPKKLYFPPRFFIELLFLLMIIIAAATPIWRDTTQKIILIVDNSLSTKAIKPNREQVFDLILDEAKSQIERYQNSASYLVYQTSPEIFATNGVWKSAAATKKLLEKLKPISARDNLENLSVTDLEPADKIIIISDRYLEIQSHAASWQSASPQPEIKAVLNQSEKLSNIALRQVIPKIDQDKVEITAQLYFMPSCKARLEIFLAKDKDNYKLLSSSNLNIASQSGEISSELPLPGLAEQVAQGMTSLKTLIVPDLSCSDALEDDNQMIIELSRARMKVDVLSPLAPEELGFKSLTSYTFQSIAAEEALKSSQDILILHRPSEIFEGGIKATNLNIERPLFLIDSESLNRSNSSNKKLTRWQEASPLLRYLNLSRISLVQHSLLTNFSLTSECLLFVEGGCVFYKDHLKGYRQLVFGFELLPFEAKKNPELSIFFLNALSWLSQGKESANLLSSTFLASESDLNRIRASTALKNSTEAKKIEKSDLTFYIAIFLALALLLDLVLLVKNSHLRK